MPTPSPSSRRTPRARTRLEVGDAADDLGRAPDPSGSDGHRSTILPGSAECTVVDQALGGAPPEDDLEPADEARHPDRREVRLLEGDDEPPRLLEGQRGGGPGWPMGCFAAVT